MSAFTSLLLPGYGLNNFVSSFQPYFHLQRNAFIKASVSLEKSFSYNKYGKEILTFLSDQNIIDYMTLRKQ